MSESREQLLDEVVTAYLKAAEAGEAGDESEWLRQYPSIAGELRAFFEGRRKVERLAAPLRPVEGPTAGLEGPGSPLGTIRYIGDYELLAEIAHGGMGVVFRARQVSLNRPVAVKMI